MKGMIEILKEVKVLVKGQKVGNSEAALLAKMNLKPFSYGMEILKVYDDGAIIAPEVISISPSDLVAKFQQGVANITALSLELGVLTQLSVPHLLVNAFKNVAAIAIETGYKLP
jgi:large subunit ribosomal protein LP0